MAQQVGPRGIKAVLVLVLLARSWEMSSSPADFHQGPQVFESPALKAGYKTATPCHRRHFKDHLPNWEASI